MIVEYGIERYHWINIGIRISGRELSASHREGSSMGCDSVWSDMHRWGSSRGC
mgnify:CR=1 FL=1|jgi:primosomal replication protein N